MLIAKLFNNRIISFYLGLVWKVEFQVIVINGPLNLLFLLQILCCGCSLESSHWDDSDEYFST